jgi:prepilin-type N-terminal cleavage/methylation domain-containing protein
LRSSSASFERRRADRGVTVIELVVVLALLSILLLVSIPALKTVFGVDLRQSSREMAATIRYVYEESMIRNMPMRIAYDLDSNNWWVEAADGAVRIFKDRDAREAFADFMAEKAESDAEVREEAEFKRSLGSQGGDILGQVFAGTEDGGESAMQGMGLLGGLFGGGGGFAPGARGGEYQVNQFTPIGDPEEDGEFVRRELPRGVRFIGVWTPAYDEVVEPMDEYELEAMLREDPEDQTWTIVYTHIFPGGYIEDSVVYLGDEAGTDLMSIAIEPLTARVQVTKGRADLPDLDDREQRQ